MSTVEITPLADPLAALPVVTKPDLSRLPAVDFTAPLALRVTDDTSAAAMKQHVRVARDAKETIEGIFEKATKGAHEAHRFLTGLRAQLIAPAVAVEQHGNRELLDYDARRDAARIALEKQLQAQADAQAAVLREQAKEAAAREREEQETLAALGLIEVPAAVEVQPTAIVAPTISIAPTKTVDTRNKPWGYKTENLGLLIAEMSGASKLQAILLDIAQALTNGSIADIKALLVKAAEVKPDPLATEILQVNDVFAKQKVRQLQSTFPRHFPGLEAVRERSIKW